MAAEQMADGSEEQRRAAPAGPAPTAPAVEPQAAPAAAPQTSPAVGPPAASAAAAGPAAEPPPPPARPLDAIDRDILRILQTDGRASIRSVAERVHVSRANAYARINRLVEDGVIRGFGARVDHERAGQGASAYITLKIVQNSWRTVREQLQALPGATHIALVSGDFDVLLLVHTPDNRALRELVLTRIQAIPEVLSTRTLLVFEETDLGPRPDRPAELA
ncbi:Lrp/AsnC family transcriptional regulator [Streptomyces griseus]|uniref:Lrp/AsnC family transcriptional regulator n=1 Tax=Streptomyces griseus TaxID=1911 RepID=UPI0036B56A3E